MRIYYTSVHKVANDEREFQKEWDEMSGDKLTRLREKQKTIAAQIQREQNRLKKEERKKDTRRKILAGAAVLHKADNEQEYKKWLIHHLLDGFLERDDDRALFGLSPRPRAEAKPTESNAEKPAGL